jgi:putative ABC transport system permease protein
MRTFLSDIRFGLRMLARKPGFTAIAVLTLALGIGANTAIFSVVDAVLLRPLPFREPDQLVALFETEGSPGNFPLTGEDYLDWRAQNKTFEDMAVYSYQERFNASSEGTAERASVVETQANFFSMLGVQPILGRPFAKGEDQAGQNHVALVSYAFWQRHFGGEKDAVGKSVELNSTKYEVVGVMPVWYRLPGIADVWIPIDASVKGLGGRGSHHLRAIGRMKSGIGVAQAQTDLKGIAARLEKQFPNSNADVSAIVNSLKEQIVGGTRSELWVMFAAVGLVLLIACVNVANLLLVRSADRKREVAIRAAMGASRGRLVRQLLTESVLLSVSGAIPGIGLAYVCVRAVANAKTFPIPQPNPVGVNATVLLFTLLVSVAIGLLFGMLPAFQTSQFKLSEDLKSGGKKAFTASARGRFVRDALVAIEVGLSLALLAGAGLLLRTFADLRQVDIGVKTENVLTGLVQLPPNRYENLQSRKLFLDRLTESLRNTPGVREVSVSTALPLTGGNNGYVQIDGSTDASLKGQLVENNAVTPDYFRVMGIPILKGRVFNPGDLDNSASELSALAKLFEANPNAKPDRHVEINVVINKAMADRFWPGQEALGKTFRSGGDTIVNRVIGIAGNTRQWNLRTAPIPETYYPLTLELQFGNGRSPFTISLLGAGPPEKMSGTLVSAVRQQDSSLAVFEVRTIPQIVSDSMTNTNYQTYLLGALSVLALVLAAVGTYGVMSFVVTQRTNEIGIRMALGAGRGQVLWMVLRQGFVMTAAGIAIGIAGTLALTRLIADFLYGVKPGDPLTLAAVCVVMAVVALAACAIPALRATRVDPSIALRYE